MKTVKTITIDAALNSRLMKEKNASKLIEHLLEEHYKKTTNPYEGWSQEAKELELKRLDKLEEADKIREEIIRVLNGN